MEFCRRLVVHEIFVIETISPSLEEKEEIPCSLTGLDAQEVVTSVMQRTTGREREAFLGTTGVRH